MAVTIVEALWLSDDDVTERGMCIDTALTLLSELQISVLSDIWITKISDPILVTSGSSVKCSIWLLLQPPDL